MLIKFDQPVPALVLVSLFLFVGVLKALRQFEVSFTPEPTPAPGPAPEPTPEPTPGPAPGPAPGPLKFHENIIHDVNRIIEILSRDKSVILNGSCKIGKGDISILLPIRIHDQIMCGKKIKCMFLKVFNQKANAPEDEKLKKHFQSFDNALCLATISAERKGFAEALLPVLRKNRDYLHVVIVDEGDYGNSINGNIREIYEVLQSEGISCRFVVPSATNYEFDNLGSEFEIMTMTRPDCYIGHDDHLKQSRVKQIKQGAFLKDHKELKMSKPFKKMVQESPMRTINILRIAQDNPQGFEKKLNVSEKKLRDQGFYLFFSYQKNTSSTKTFRFDGTNLETCLENYGYKSEFFDRLNRGEKVHFILVLNKVAGRQTKFEFNHLVSLYYQYYSKDSKPALNTFIQEIGRVCGYYTPHPRLRLAIPDKRALQAELAFNKSGDIKLYQQLLKDMKMRPADRDSMAENQKRARTKMGQLGEKYRFIMVSGDQTREALYKTALISGYKARTAIKKDAAAVSTINGDRDAIDAILGNKWPKLGGSKGQVFDSAWVKFDGKFHPSNKEEEKLSLLKYYPDLSSANEENPAYILLAKGLDPLPETAIHVPFKNLLPNTNLLDWHFLEIQMAS